MATTAQTARLAIAQAIVARLNTLATVPGFVAHLGEMHTEPPLKVTGGHPDPSGRVAAYAVVHTSGGAVDLNPVLAAKPTDTLWTGQITFAAGYLEDLLVALDAAVPLLQLWTPTIEGLSCGRLRQDPTFRPPPARRDTNPSPHRFWTPTMWELHAVTAAPVDA